MRKKRCSRAGASLPKRTCGPLSGSLCFSRPAIPAITTGQFSRVDCADKPLRTRKDRASRPQRVDLQGNISSCRCLLSCPITITPRISLAPCGQCCGKVRRSASLSSWMMVRLDLSIEVVEEFQRDHPVIRLIKHAKNRGAPAALNTGLATASCEFVYFAAADDFVLGDFFSVATAALTEFPEAAYFCGHVVCVDRDGNVTGFRPLLQPLRMMPLFRPQRPETWPGASTTGRWDQASYIGASSCSKLADTMKRLARSRTE